jgi:hypothetical protein
VFCYLFMCYVRLVQYPICIVNRDGVDPVTSDMLCVMLFCVLTR